MTDTPPDNGAPRSPITLRALLIGAACAVFTIWASIYSLNVLKSSYLAGTFLAPMVVFTFALVVLVLNGLLKWRRPASALDRGELVVVFVIVLMASAIPTYGWTENVITQVAGFTYYSNASYFSSVRGAGEDVVAPFVARCPAPLFPSDAEGAVKHLFEGLPRDGSSRGIPWGAWLAPLLWWSTFFLAMYFAMFCVCVILRRQWVERERLVFPLARIPMEIVQAENRSEIVNRFFRNPLLWFGALVPVLIDTLTALHAHTEWFPRVPLWSGIDVVGKFRIYYSLSSWVWMGLAYIIATDVCFSMWFFMAIKIFVTAYLKHVGWTIRETNYFDFYSFREPSVAHVCMGALLVLVGVNLWTARRHLADVFRKAVKGDPSVDDRGEALPYRVAVFGGLAALTWMWVWLMLAGMQWWLGILLLAICFAVFLGLTRLVIEGGALTGSAPFLPQAFITRMIGTSLLTTSSMFTLGVSFAWFSSMRVFLMPFFAHSLRISDTVKIRRRGLSWVMMVTLLVAMALSVAVFFHYAYQEGGINLHKWFFIRGAKRPATFASRLITHPTNPATANYPLRWGLTTGGGLLMGALYFMRTRFLWWPLHPLGLPFIPFSGIWTMVAAVWIFKVVILKYGGVRVYAKLKPVFLGFILGKLCSACVWFLIDLLTGVMGNRLYNM